MLLKWFFWIKDYTETFILILKAFFVYFVQALAPNYVIEFFCVQIMLIKSLIKGVLNRVNIR